MEEELSALESQVTRPAISVHNEKDRIQDSEHLRWQSVFQCTINVTLVIASA